MKTLLLAAALLMASVAPAAAQVHPCDAPPELLPEPAAPGVPFGVGFCFNLKTAGGVPTTVDQFKVFIDTVLVWSGPLAPLGSASPTGWFEFGTPKTITAARGTHIITVVASNAVDGDGLVSDPFGFLSRMPPPGQVKKIGIVK